MPEECLDCVEGDCNVCELIPEQCRTCDDDDCNGCVVQLELPMEVPHARNDVPWTRRGSPRMPNSGDREEWGKRIANAGPFLRRLPYDNDILNNSKDGSFLGGLGVYGMEERAFAKNWDYENNGPFSRPSIMDHLLSDPIFDDTIKTDHDRYVAELVAQAVIQWLGTNCGAAFVQESQRIGREDKERLRRKIAEARVIRLTNKGHSLTNEIAELERVMEVKINSEVTERDRARREYFGDRARELAELRA